MIKKLFQRCILQYPSNFTTNFSLAGQLKAENAEITLNFGFGSKVFESVKVKLDKKSLMTDNSLVSRIWAQKKISELDMLYEKNKDEIIALGKKHSIVTRNTSLIVLDRIEDYVQYEIVPPKELQKEYFEIVENQNKEKQRFEQEQLEKVVEYFNARVKWWETKFTKEKKIVNKDPKKNGNVTDSTVVEVLEIVEDEMNVSEEAISDAVIMVEDVITEENGGYLHGGKKKDKSEKDRVSSIKLNAWDPQTPYMIKIKEAQNKYQTYLELKKTYASTPSFYLDVANYFVKLGDKKLGLRILSNIAEMEVQNHELMRILAHRLEQLEYYDLAIAIYEEVVKIRSEEPQSFRDLSLCLAADKQYQKALDIIYKAIKKPWDSRFPEVEGIMAVEMNRIISKAGSAVDTKNIDKRLIKDMPVDIRIVLNWDTDNSDMDLWVTDPYEVKCFYSHPLTYTGGRMSRDFTGGYGPEEFMIKEALTGQYKVQANYYGSRAQKITGPTTIYLEIYTNYGKPNEKKETITMQLAEKAEVVDIGVMEFGK
jgi:tetratricopeptide (TPR) repeat protein